VPLTNAVKRIVPSGRQRTPPVPTALPTPVVIARGLSGWSASTTQRFELPSERRATSARESPVTVIVL
jgi:hypothetical protein